MGMMPASVTEPASVRKVQQNANVLLLLFASLKNARLETAVVGLLHASVKEPASVQDVE